MKLVGYGGLLLIANPNRKDYAFETIMEYLKTLSYYGDEGFGLAVTRDSNISIWKDLNFDAVRELQGKIDTFDCLIGICRYAIYGRPSIPNTPPFVDCTRSFLLAARGVISDSASLRLELIKSGHLIEGVDLSELLVHKIEESIRHSLSLDKALIDLYNNTQGIFSAVLFDTKCSIAYLLTKGLTEYVGVDGEKSGRVVISSEPDVMAKNSWHLFEISSGIVRISNGGIEIVLGELVKPQIHLRRVVGGFDYYMEREMSEIPIVLSAQEYAQPQEYVSMATKLIKNSEKVFIIGSGSSYNSALYGGYLISELSEIQPIVQNAVEFIYFHLQKVNLGDIIIANSQSGKTTDVMRAVTKSRMRGAIIIGILNRLGTPLMFASNLYFHIAAGIEVAIPATKTFVAQLATFARLAIELSDIAEGIKKELKDQLKKLPDLAAKIMIECPAIVDNYALRVHKFDNAFILGRAANYPIAIEGALKLKEVAHIHAEGLNSGEFRHGTKTLVEYGYPIVFLIPQDPEAREDTYELISEIKDRGNEILVITDKDDPFANKFAKFVVQVPKVHDLLEPILYVLPLQRLAFKLGVLRGKPIDQPPELTKYVVKRKEQKIN